MKRRMKQAIQSRYHSVTAAGLALNSALSPDIDFYVRLSKEFIASTLCMYM